MRLLLKKGTVFMALLNIIKEGDETLRRVSRPVTEITPRIITLLDDMTETMHKAEGCGLAAVQVGVLRRVVVIEVEEGKTYEMINPEIIAAEGEQTEQEGCLSVPRTWGKTRRPQKVTVKYTDRHGEEKTLTGEGLLARAICHETDHLDGKLFLDVLIEPPIREEDEPPRRRKHAYNKK